MLSIKDFESLVPDKSLPVSQWDWTKAFDKLMQSNEINVMIPSGTYLLKYTLKITKPKNIYGNEAILMLEAPLQIEGSNINLNDLKFRSEKQVRAIHLHNIMNVSVHHCDFENIMETAIYFENESHQNVSITDCNFENIGRNITNIVVQGNAVYVQNAATVFIENCEMHDIWGQSAITVRSSSDIKITNCIIEDTAYRGIQTYGSDSGSAADSVRNMEITECEIRRTGELNQTLQGDATNGIFVRNPQGTAADVKISNCTIEYCGENFIEGNFHAFNNTMKYSGYYPHFTTPSKEGLFPQTNSVIEGNSIHYSYLEAIKLFFSRNNIVINNNTIHDWDMTTASKSSYLPAITMQTKLSSDVMNNITIQNNTITGPARKLMNGNTIKGEQEVIKKIPSPGTFGTITYSNNQIILE
ncbi:right-handed parallel beta-helix repeat-containing protein [Paenibacillus sp. FSL F4-0087]|uniref:right-handed parallel beta-helix repeat-containing protein n=1 Tax=Paenibacillus sp. FSL F4-0087 TaxID=2921368 RepID=UPI0009700A58|nr:hypothetical protein BK122_25330 [Paenibacillus pabuli]